MAMDIFGDESGNFDFDPRTGSRFFFVATMATTDASLATHLLALRQNLHLRRLEVHPDGFHCAEDKQAVRDEVFRLLAQRDVRVDCTYYTKAKVHDRIRTNLDYFYRWAWYHHLRHLLPRTVDHALPFIAIATLGEKKKRVAYEDAFNNVVRSVLGRVDHPRCAYWSASSHPCLQAADYYTWAIARWLERGDPRSYDLVKHQLSTLHPFV